MKTTSQSKEVKSRHAARESSGKTGRVALPNTAFSSLNTALVICRARETFTRARSLIAPFIGFLFFGALGALAVGLVSHFAVVVPLEKNLLSAEARSLATEFDSAVRVRSSLISITAGSSELDSFLESGGLDKMVTALRTQFPDFLSFEATNDRGQVQAMGGELPLSQAGLFSTARSGPNSTVNLGIPHNKGIFHDDPENNCFYITCKHVGSEGGKWFTRSRFSRESVVAILKSTTTRHVTLVPIAGTAKDIPEGAIPLSMPQSCAVRTIGSRWSGPTGAEALLTMPGWLMRMDNTAARPVLWRAPIAVPLCLILCTVIASIVLKYAPPREDHDRDVAVGAEAGSKAPAGDKDSRPQPEPCETCASCSAGRNENSSQVPENQPTPREVQYGKPAAGGESFESPCRADLPCVTKVVTIPVHKSPIETANIVGQESSADHSGENELVPDTLEVSWFEPCEHCETGKPPREEKNEGATILSDEEKNPGSERFSAGGHPLSISG